MKKKPKPITSLQAEDIEWYSGFAEDLEIGGCFLHFHDMR